MEIAIIYEDGALYIFDNKDPLKNHLVIERSNKKWYIMGKIRITFLWWFAEFELVKVI